jgi:putative redox protein
MRIGASMAGKETTITAHWKGGMGFETVNAQGITVRMDPPSESAYLTPMELVLMALAGCTGMDVADILRKKRQSVAALEIQARGVRADDHPKVYTEIELVFLLTGDGLAPEAIARAIDLSAEKYCSVGAMLEPAVPIRTSFRIIPGKEGSA